MKHCSLCFSAWYLKHCLHVNTTTTNSASGKMNIHKTRTNNESVTKVASLHPYKSSCKCEKCFFSPPTYVRFILSNTPQHCGCWWVFNSSRCRVWTTAGSKAAHELVEEAEEALQQESPDTPTTWSMRVFIAYSVQPPRYLQYPIMDSHYDYVLCTKLNPKQQRVKRAQTSALLSSPWLITNPNPKSPNSWSALWLHRPGFYMSSVALCHSLWARPPPVWTDLPEWLTNWSTGLVLVESLADWLVASDACFPACLPVKCKPNGPLAGWAGCDTEPHHWGLDRKPVVGGCSPLTLLVLQTLLWNTHWKTQPSSAVGYIFASSDG